MMEYIDISILNPAEYNPRLLTNEAQEDLKKSIKELGIIKPIIIRQSDKRIMAGHQRTKTMKLLGYTHVPAFILDGVNSTDEVRFNQLHNYAECELSEIQPEINVSLPKGTEGFYTGEFYQFNLSSCIRQQNSLTAQFVSFSLSNLANIFYPPQFLQ